MMRPEAEGDGENRTKKEEGRIHSQGPTGLQTGLNVGAGPER